MTTEPLGFEAGAELWPAGTKELADRLEALGVTANTSRRKAREVMREHAIEGRNSVLGKALKYLGTRVGTTLDWITPQPSGDQPGTTTPKHPLTSGDHPGDQRGPLAAGKVGTSGPPHRGTTSTPGPTRTCRCGQPATDISGLCAGCLTNPGTLPPRNPELDF